MDPEMVKAFFATYGVGVFVSTIVEGAILSKVLKRNVFDRKVILNCLFTHIISLPISISLLFLGVFGSFYAMANQISPALPILGGISLFIFGEVILNELIFPRLLKGEQKNVSLSLKPFFWGNLISFLLMLFLFPLYFSIG